MIEMREDQDGVFRSDEDHPRPYGLQDDPQEPYVAIVAPNIDKVTSRTFDTSILGGQRAKRGFFVALASIACGLGVIGGVVAIQTVFGLLGIE